MTLHSSVRSFASLTATCCLALSALAEDSPTACPDNAVDFAVYALALNSPLILESIDPITLEYELPDSIKIENDRSHWDVDIRETDAFWMYDGFTVNTKFYASGRVVESGLVAGPPKLQYRVMGLVVFDPKVKLMHGLSVGVTAKTVIETLGLSAYYKNGDTTIDYRCPTESTRDITVEFKLDTPNGVVEKIVWGTTSWH